MKHLKLFATLRDVVGAPSISVPFDEGSVRDLIAAIAKVHPVLAQKIVDDRGEMTGLVHLRRRPISTG
jgi:hypothetical protein